MRNFNIPPEEDENDMFATSPIPYEQVSATTQVPDAFDQIPKVEQEMSNSDQIQNELSDLASNFSQAPIAQEQGNLTEQDIQRATSPKSVLDRYTELKQLQDNQSSDLRNAGMLQGANQIAQGFALGSGAKIDDGSGSVKMLQQLAKQPVEDYGVRQKDEDTQMKLALQRSLRDKGSNVSQITSLLAKQQALKAGLSEEQIAPIGDMSADEIQLLKLGNAGDSLKSRFQTKVRTNPETGLVEIMSYDTVTGEMTPINDGVLAGYKPDVRTDKRTNELLKINSNLPVARVEKITGPKAIETTEVNAEGKIEPKKSFSEFDLQNSLDVKKYDDFQKVREQFSSEVKEDKAAAAKVDGVIKLIEEAEKNPAASGMAGAAVARLIEKGVLTDQDVIRYAQRNGILNQLQDKLNKFVTGEFSPELARDISSSIKTYQRGAQDSINKRALTYGKQFRGAIDPTNPISEENIAKMIYADYASPVKSNNKSLEKQIVKKGYNSKSDKTELIYSDGTKKVVDGKQ